MNASRSKVEVFNPEIAEETEVLRRNNECDCARTEDENARLVNGGQKYPFPNFFAVKLDVLSITTPDLICGKNMGKFV
jgi:hypothetical protein